MKMLMTERPLTDSGLVCLIILRTSRGRRSTSPIPTRLVDLIEGVSSLGWNRRLAQIQSINNEPAGSGLQPRLVRFFAKDGLESALVVGVEEVDNDGLTSELVSTLQDLVASGPSETREKRSVFAEGALVGSILFEAEQHGKEHLAREIGELTPR